jgi:hypothetical protein
LQQRPQGHAQPQAEQLDGDVSQQQAARERHPEADPGMEHGIDQQRNSPGDGDRRGGLLGRDLQNQQIQAQLEQLSEASDQQETEQGGVAQPGQPGGLGRLPLSGGRRRGHPQS